MSLSRLLSCNASSSSSPSDSSSGEDLGYSGKQDQCWFWETPVGEMGAVLSLQVQAKCSSILYAETSVLS